MQLRAVASCLALLSALSACAAPATASTFTPPPAPTSAPPTASPVPATSTFAPTPTPAPATIEVTIYFTDSNRYAVGQEPYEVGVTRLIPAGADVFEAVLVEFFKGPTQAEQQSGLSAITSGATGFSALTVEDGIARVYLAGGCASNGATYTVAQPVIRNLTQFPEITAVKIYDPDGGTEIPDGLGNSIPFCLEP